MEHVTQEQFQKVVNELLGRIKTLEDNMQEESDALRSDSDSELNSLRLEMYDMRSDLEQEINDLREELTTE